MLETIERKPQIDGLSKQGEIPAQRCTGGISLRGVTFAYPSRPEASVCVDYNLDILPGDCVALVGASGCGKVRIISRGVVVHIYGVADSSMLMQSTIVNLLLRFYDPQAGQVLLDGRDLRELNVRYLRSQIGYVASLWGICSFAKTINFGCDLPQVRGSGTSAVCRNYWREYRVRPQRADAGRRGRHHHPRAE
jgi:ABC-type multidrug transport system fused ATPase/permease subunit